jgi:hypothetical protein
MNRLKSAIAVAGNGCVCTRSEVLLRVMLALIPAFVVLLVALYPCTVRSASSMDNSPEASSGRLSTQAGSVLVIPHSDCRDASIILAKVTRHIRDAERIEVYSSQAEDDYDEALQAIIERRFGEGIEHLLAADRWLRQMPDTELIFPPNNVGEGR